MAQNLAAEAQEMVKEGKYLTFALAREEYGLEILKVREIIGYTGLNKKMRAFII